MRMDTRSWPQSAVGGAGNTTAIAAQGDQVSVLIAHADPIIRAGLAALLGSHGDMQIAVTDAEAPLDSHAGADVIILDHRSGLEHMRRAANAHHGDTQPRVLIVTQLEREWEVRTAMMAGVHGYLLQNADSEQLLTAVRTLSRGMRYLSAELSRLRGRQLHPHRPDQPRDRRAATAGAGPVQQIDRARAGHRRRHGQDPRQRSFDKLGATARTHAVVLATRRGLVGEPYGNQQH